MKFDLLWVERPYRVDPTLPRMTLLWCTFEINIYIHIKNKRIKSSMQEYKKQSKYTIQKQDLFKALCFHGDYKNKSQLCLLKTVFWMFFFSISTATTTTSSADAHVINSSKEEISERFTYPSNTTWTHSSGWICTRCSYRGRLHKYCWCFPVPGA